MPELPEVETVLHGLKPHIEGAIIQDVVVRHYQLRWPIPSTLQENLRQQPVGQLSRRGKYLLMPLKTGTLIMHLGMSGSLRIVTLATPNSLSSSSMVEILSPSCQWPVSTRWRMTDATWTYKGTRLRS